MQIQVKQVQEVELASHIQSMMMTMTDPRIRTVWKHLPHIVNAHAPTCVRLPMMPLD